MPEEFLGVPDWFSAENQGAGIAVATLGGARHLVVGMVDAGPQQNRGLYRIGRNLDDDGAVTGGWTPWIDVPDWFSWDNQGADLAVADFGNGRTDLVVMMIDDRPEQNAGLYRIGRDLDVDGVVHGGWTPWIEIPDWFSWDNQDCGICVTPPNAQGNHDLVVFMIDNQLEVNRGVYRIGRGVTADGALSGGWTQWIDVPGWFSWANQGAGIAVADLDGDGGRDLIVLQVDDGVQTAVATGLNQAFFRVGRDLDADGTIADWGVDWLGVPHWFSWANQGAGVAVSRLGNVTRLLALCVDAAVGQNNGSYQVVDLDQDPGVYGAWELKTFHSGVLAVHAATLPGGDVLFFAGSGSSQVRFDSPDFGNIDKGVPTSVVWTPPNNTFAHPPTLRTPNGRPFDFFCGGDAFLADGRLVSAGGTQGYGPFTGRKDVARFDPVTQTWSFVKAMAHGRWYPTLITLGDGRILATTGLDADGQNGSRRSLEFYDSGTDTWTAAEFQAGFPGLPLYAHLFLLADGRVFFSGGRMDDQLGIQPCLFDVTLNPVPTQPVNDLLDPVLRNQSASVLLPPAQDQRVMVSGGGPPEKEDKTHATGQVSIVDLTRADPEYLPATPMALPRMHLNTVLLPDRTVFVSGGSLKQEDEPLSRLQSELYDPATNTWRLTATASVARLYHSTAVLLADGRVVAAGGNPEGGHSVPFEPPDENEEMQIEVFSPPYLFKGSRPVITSAPETAGYGETISIQTPTPQQVRWVSLVRNGVTTHSFDSGQRLVDLPIAARTAGTVTGTLTDEPNLAPPGWYMLFLIDNSGTPSIAEWIRIR